MENLMTQEELCNYLKVTKMTLYRWRQEGMPFERVGKQVRYVLKDVQEWLKSNTKEFTVKK